MKVLTVVGTRPEAIKMAPVIKEMARHTGLITQVVCATAQHREMLDQALGIFGIVPDHDLGVMRPNQSLSELTANLLRALDEVVVMERPDWVLVQGDTTTAMTAGLVAFYRGVRLAHVEAGLRSNDRTQPFPEEVNRRIADMLADLCFAPTERNRQYLLREGVHPQAIFVTGNPGIDALLMTVNRVGHRSLEDLIGSVDRRRLILVTVHRRESFGSRLLSVCEALRQIAQRYSRDVHIVFPVHRNPRVWKPVQQVLSSLPNVSLLEPVDYETAVFLLSKSDFVLTDSGGLQEEAPSLHKPVLVLRTVTERPELVDLGGARLVGTDPRTIVEETDRLLSDQVLFEQMASVPNPYGDGAASQRIVTAILAAAEGETGVQARGLGPDRFD